MQKHISVNPDSYAPRWLSYFDLLGFTKLIETRDWSYVFSSYTQAIGQFTSDQEYKSRIEKVWFSDTFLLWSIDDSIQSFSEIERISRFFINNLIQSNIPVRGAMACQEFYVDKDNNLFFGKALIEAYHYGENQDWLGFILTPSTVKQLKKVGYPDINNIFNYPSWDIPYKKADASYEKRLPALLIGHQTPRNWRTHPIKILKEMRDRAGDAYKTKYENTLRFIEAYGKQEIQR